MPLKAERELWALVGAITAFAVALLLLILLNYLGYVASPDVAYLSVLVISVALFLLLSGRLSKISGGGFSAEFQAVAEEPAESGDISAPGEDLFIVAKRGLTVLDDTVAGIGDGDFVALRLRFGHVAGSYNANDVRKYVETISAITPNSYVLVVDASDQFVGAVEATRFAKLGNTLLAEFVTLVNESNRARLTRLNFVHTTQAQVGIDNRRALEIMRRDKTGFIVLVDAGDHPKKITTRSQVLERLVLALARSAASL